MLTTLRAKTKAVNKQSLLTAVKRVLVLSIYILCTKTLFSLEYRDLSLYSVFQAVKVNKTDISNRAVKVILVVPPDQETWSSGNLIGGGLILTVAHSLRQGPGQLIVILNNKPSVAVSATFVSSNSVCDLALLAMRHIDADKVVINTNPRIGDRVTIIGNSVNGDFQAVETYIKNITNHLTASFTNREQILLPKEGIYPGFSGAGVYNKAGELLGIVTWCNGIWGYGSCGAVTGKDILEELGGEGCE